MTRRRRQLWFGPPLAALLVALAGTFAAAASTAAGSPGPSRPLQVVATSLIQDGRQLLWRVELKEPFSPAGFARDGRALCLLIERAGTGRPTGQACLAGPGHGSTAPRFTYLAAPESGNGRVINATITRSSSDEVSAEFLPSAVGATYRPLRWQVISSLIGAGCALAKPGQASCVAEYPPKPALLQLHRPQLAGCLPAGSSLVYRGSSNRREVALTFDDGPWNQPSPAAFLNVLEREHVPATFFEIGRQISTYDPDGAYERRMLADGDMIGDHTWSHPNVTTLPASEQRQQLLSTADAIRRATHGFSPCLWRPPYGAISPALVTLARSLGFLTIMWDVDPRDWATPGVGAIYDDVVSDARDGAIVLQHFGGGPRYQTIAALPQEIDTLRSEGYRFVTVAEMLRLRLVYR